MKSIHEMGVPNWAARWLRARVSSVEATTVLLDRMSQHAALGAVLASDRELALQQAKAADARRAAGESAPLLGVPIAHKDIFASAELPTTAARRCCRATAARSTRPSLHACRSPARSRWPS